MNVLIRACAAALALAATAAPAAVRYSIIELGNAISPSINTGGAFVDFTGAGALNDFGTVVGTRIYTGFTDAAFVYRPDIGSTILPVPGSHFNIAGIGINNAGNIAGTMYYAQGHGAFTPFLWNEAEQTAHLFYPVDGAAETELNDINNHNQIVGSYLRPDMSNYQAFLWDPEIGAIDIPGASGVAAINDNGQVMLAETGSRFCGVGSQEAPCSRVARLP